MDYLTFKSHVQNHLIDIICQEFNLDKSNENVLSHLKSVTDVTDLPLKYSEGDRYQLVSELLFRDMTSKDLSSVMDVIIENINI